MGDDWAGENHEEASAPRTDHSVHVRDEANGQVHRVLAHFTARTHTRTEDKLNILSLSDSRLAEVETPTEKRIIHRAWKSDVSLLLTSESEINVFFFSLTYKKSRARDQKQRGRFAIPSAEHVKSKIALHFFCVFS